MTFWLDTSKGWRLKDVSNCGCKRYVNVKTKPKQVVTVPCTLHEGKI